jgi:hypothetical protein
VRFAGQPVCNYVNVITGLRNQAALVQPVDPTTGMPTGGSHSRGTASLMNGVPVTLTGASGPSVDQVAAATFGTMTRLPSLPVAAFPARAPGAADGLTTAHQDNISWSATGAPVPAERDPHQMFLDVFGSLPTTDPSAQRLVAQRRSILDFVQADISRLEGTLGSADRARLDEHLTAIQQLQHELMFTPATSCTAPMDPGAAGASLQEDLHAQLLIRLQVMALKCDIARCGSFQVRRGGANDPLQFLAPPITEGQHTISHDNSPPGFVLFRQLTQQFDVAIFAYLVQQLANTPDGNGSLIDNTLVFCSSEISEGARHNHDDMPILLAGRAGGVVSGRHLLFPTTTAVNSLYLTMLQKVGVPATSFGTSITPQYQTMFATSATLNLS